MKRVLVLVLVIGLGLAFPSSANAEEPTPSKPETTSPLRARAFGGVTRGSLFDLPIGGPMGGASIGAGLRRSWGGIDGYADFAYDSLSTEHGVGVRRFDLGVSAELIVWHFRAGVGWDIGMASVSRLSGSNESARRVFIGGHATLGVDLFTVAGFTPYVQGRGDYNTAFPSLGLNSGLRYAF
jgi:hypothetical protein